MSSIRTAKRMVERIRSFMNDWDVPPSEQKALWDLLTALRGPDQDYAGKPVHDAKNDITARIRYQMLGGGAWEGMANLNSRPFPNGGLRSMKEHLAAVGEHFWAHAEAAEDALKRLGLYRELKAEAPAEQKEGKVQ